VRVKSVGGLMLSLPHSPEYSWRLHCGLGLVHYIPLLAYLGFRSCAWFPLPEDPAGALLFDPVLAISHHADHFVEYPLGANVLTILILAGLPGRSSMEAFAIVKTLPDMACLWCLSVLLDVVGTANELHRLRFGPPIGTF